MMKNKKNASIAKKNMMIDLMIVFGFFFIILGSSLLCVTVRGQPFGRIVLPLCVMSAGAFSFAVFFFFRRRLMFFGFALASTLSGLTELLTTARIIPFSYGQIWPLYLVFVALSLFICGCIHCKRLHPAYSIPSLMLMILGIVFFLFSTGIISMPLRSFVALWWPLFIILGGLFVILMFFEMRRKIG